MPCPLTPRKTESGETDTDLVSKRRGRATNSLWDEIAYDERAPWERGWIILPTMLLERLSKE